MVGRKPTMPPSPLDPTEKKGPYPVLVGLWAPASKAGHSRLRGPMWSHSHGKQLPALWEFWGFTPKNLTPTPDELIYAKGLKWFLAFRKHSINVNFCYHYCYYLVMLEIPSTGHGLPASNRRYCVREKQSWKSLFGRVTLGNHLVSLSPTFLT